MRSKRKSHSRLGSRLRMHACLTELWVLKRICSNVPVNKVYRKWEVRALNYEWIAPILASDVPPTLEDTDRVIEMSRRDARKHREKRMFMQRIYPLLSE